MLSRRKGKTWEREVAKRFRAVMPGEEIKRGIQSRGGTKEVPDVDMPYFLIECKHGIQTNPRAALVQAEEAVGTTGKVPVAVCKDNRQEPFIAMRFEAFLALVKEWWMLRKRTSKVGLVTITNPIRLLEQSINGISIKESEHGEEEDEEGDEEEPVS